MADPAYIDADGVLTDGEAWVGIATTTLGVDTATVTFTSTDDGQVGDFSQYMDLVVVGYCRGDRSATNAQIYIYLNSDTTDTNYEIQLLRGSGSSASAVNWSKPAVGYAPASTAGANEFCAFVTDLIDVTSGKFTTYITRNAQDSNGDGWAALSAVTWKSQAGVTDITIQPFSDSWVTGSMFSLFGVLPRMVTA